MQNMFAYNERNDLESSIAFLRKAISLEPGTVTLKTSLAWRYMQFGQLDLALQNYDEALRMDPLGVARPEFPRFITVYELSGEWGKARQLIADIIDRFDNDTFWLERLAFVNFHQSKDPVVLMSELRNVPGFPSGPEREAWMSVQARDFEAVLQYDFDALDPLRFFYGDISGRFTSMTLRPLSVLKALIHFEQNDREAWLKEAANAKGQIEQLASEADSIAPWQLSTLAIVHALEGNVELMESVIEDVRAMTELSYWRYFHQVECELHIAIAYLVLGQHDQALTLLEEASQRESALFLECDLRLWFFFDRLRGNPRFEALLK